MKVEQSQPETGPNFTLRYANFNHHDYYTHLSKPFQGSPLIVSVVNHWTMETVNLEVGHTKDKIIDDISIPTGYEATPPLWLTPPCRGEHQFVTAAKYFDLHSQEHTVSLCLGCLATHSS